MPTVTFTVCVNKAAALPAVRVHVGLDQDDDQNIEDVEFTPATKQGDGSYQASFVVPSTAGRLWMVVVRAATNSTYTIAATSDGVDVLPGGASGVAYPNPLGATTGVLA